MVQFTTALILLAPASRRTRLIIRKPSCWLFVSQLKLHIVNDEETYQ